MTMFFSIKKAIKGSCTALTAASALILGAVTVLSQQLPGRFSVVEGSALELQGAVAASDLSFAGDAQEVSALEAGSSYTASLKLMGLFPVKDVTVSVVEPTMVVPCGQPFGIKMFTDGVLVVGMSDVDTESGSYNPARSAGMKIGDVIISINGTAVTRTEPGRRTGGAVGGKNHGFPYPAGQHCL